MSMDTLGNSSAHCNGGGQGVEPWRSRKASARPRCHAGRTSWLNVYITLRPAGKVPRAGCCEADARMRARGEAAAADRHSRRAQGPVLSPDALAHHLPVRRWLENFVSAPTTRTVISPLSTRKALVLLGKAEHAMNSPWGRPTRIRHFGPVKNPWDVTRRVPGGSVGRLGGHRSRRAWRQLPRVPTRADPSASRRHSPAFPASGPPTAACSRYGMVAFASSLDQGGALALRRRRTSRLDAER